MLGTGAAAVLGLAMWFCAATAAAATDVQRPGQLKVMAAGKRRKAGEALLQLSDHREGSEAGIVPPVKPQGSDRVVVDLGPAVEREEEAFDHASSKEAAVQKKREKVASLLWLEGRLRDVRRGLDDKAFAADEAAKQRAAGAESQEPRTVRMLSQMREQMHTFAAPMYRQAVDDELLHVAERRQSLLQEIAPAEVPQDVPQALASSSEPIVTDEDIITTKKNTKVRSARTGQVVFGISILLAIGLAVYAGIVKRED
mmetsp:Transcript_48714/g.122966  ORF Transcript_48714/g.122966 Transcript_48714/m.122966 type:complete len:256 (+) Transcript_48714:85-852(+)